MLNKAFKTNLKRKVNNMEIVKKLTVGKLVGKFVRDLPDNGTLELGQVVGLVRGTKSGTSNFGDWTALTGDFVFAPSHGPEKGKQFRSGTLFVPDVVLDLVTPIAMGLDRGGAVEIAFSIGAKADDKSTVGYTYTANFLRDPAENDPLLSLVNSTINKTPALSAPEKGSEKAAEKSEGGERPALKSRG